MTNYKPPHFMPPRIAELQRMGLIGEAKALSAEYNAIIGSEADGFSKLVDKGALALLATTAGVAGALYLITSQVSPVHAGTGPAVATHDVAWKNQARYEVDEAAAKHQLGDYYKMYGLNR